MTDRELDALVHERVMGGRRVQWIMTAAGDMDASYNADEPEREPGKGGYMKYVPWYSRNGSAMLAVIDRMAERGYGCDISAYLFGAHEVAFMWNRDDGEDYEHDSSDEVLSSKDATLPRAVCLAALWALGVEVR